MLPIDPTAPPSTTRTSPSSVSWASDERRCRVTAEAAGSTYRGGGARSGRRASSLTGRSNEMDVTRTQAAVYVGAGAATATAFTALKHGLAPKALGLGVATGIVAGGTQTLV